MTAARLLAASRAARTAIRTATTRPVLQPLRTTAERADQPPFYNPLRDWQKTSKC